MSEEQMRDRYEAVLFGKIIGDFHYSRFKSGMLTPQEEKQYFDFLENKLPRLEPLIIETATSVSGVSAKIDQHNPDILLIDSAYLMEDDRGAKEDWLRVAHITRDLKVLAKRRKLPIFINSQADSTTSKKTGPELENIGFSRSIGHDCLPKNTSVVTQDGVKLIQHLEGEVFKVFNGESYHKARCVYAGEKEQVVIKNRGKSFSCSPNHKVYVYDNEVCDFVWKKARDIEPINDFLLENNQTVSEGYQHILRVDTHRGVKEINIPIDATKELGKLIGIFIGDGSIRPHSKGQVTVSCGYNKDYAKECLYLVKKYFNLKGEIRYLKTKHSKSEQLMATWYSRAFSDWLRFMIEPNGNKTLLPQFLEMNLEFRAGILSGLIESNGSVKGQVEYVSIQEDIIDNLSILCNTLGIMTRKDRCTKEPNDKFRLRLRSKDLYKAPLTLTKYKLGGYIKLLNSQANAGYLLPSNYVKNIFNNVDIGSYPKNIRTSMYAARKEGKCSTNILSLAEQELNLKTSFMYKFIRVEEVKYSKDVVPMWDIQIYSDDKRMITGGFVTHNSDVVMSLFQDEQMREDKEMKIKIIKQREGTLGHVILNWDFTTMNFEAIYSNVSAENNEKKHETDGVLNI